MKLGPLGVGSKREEQTCVSVFQASVPETAADRSRFEPRLPIPSDVRATAEAETGSGSSR